MKTNVTIKIEGKPAFGKSLLADKIKIFLEQDGYTVEFIDEDQHILEVKK